MKIKVGVFFGGKSVEHEVSIITAIQAIENMNRDKYDIIPVYISKENKMYCGDLIGDIKQYKNMEHLLESSTQVTLAQVDQKVCLLRCHKKLYENMVYDTIDIAFPIVHGTNVEDGTLQGYLKMFNIPYVGSDVSASAFGMDKVVFKYILKEHGIPVLDCKCFSLEDYQKGIDVIISKIEDEFSYPVIVKPANLGSSVGIEVAQDKDQLQNALETAFGYAKKVVVEKAITNLKEVNCSVIGDWEDAKASECEEPVKTEEILSFHDKYLSGSKKIGGGKNGGLKSSGSSMNAGVLKLPAEISKETKEQIQELSIRTFQALGCSGVARIDFLIDQDTSFVYVNEINTIPGSLSFHLWKATGLAYPDLLDTLINLSLKRNREEKNITYSFDSNILAGYSSDNFQGFRGSKINK